jgi:hypothetical protein
MAPNMRNPDPAPREGAPVLPTRGSIFGAVALLPVLVLIAYVEVAAAIGDSLDDVQARSHHVTGPLWLGIFALLGVAGPVSAALAAWHTRTEQRSLWQAALRAEMACLLIGMPAAFLLLVA